MPTVIAIDASISMHRPVAQGEEAETLTRIELAEVCATRIMKYITTKSKLESVALLSFSSTVQRICEFSRNFSQLKSSMEKLKLVDKSCFSSLVLYLNEYIPEQWGCMEPCQVIVITDGRVVWPEGASCSSRSNIFKFTSHLHFLCLETTSMLTSSGCMECMTDILKQNNGRGSITPLLKPHTSRNEIRSIATTLLEKVLADHFRVFIATLACGSLKGRVSVYPPLILEASDTKWNDTFEIVGFLNISEAGNPPVLSRHLLLPMSDDAESSHHDEAGESGSQPSLSVILHGSLKVENKVALAKVAPDWFGLVSSWAESKTKSSLIFSLLPFGAEPVPWLGNLKQLGPSSLLASTHKKADMPSFPVQQRKGTKRSYAQSTVAWTRPTGLQTDIQKILRSAKKLPEKSQVFYKDLNRLRKAALAFGFHDLLEGISLLLERECTLLPGTAHPEATLQLSHAARELKASINLGYEHNLEPLKTDFKFNR